MRVKVLIVEDERIPASYLKKVLIKHDYDVVGSLSSAEEAIESAKTLDIDIILMDIMLKGAKTGLDAALEIKSFAPNIKVIFLTAYSEDIMLDQAIQSDAYAYLVKPYRETEILTTIKLASQKSVKKTKSRLLLACDYTYDFKMKKLIKANEAIHIGPIADNLIRLLCESSPSVISSEQICRILYDDDVSKQTLRSLIHRIRELTCKELIVSVNKSGYQIKID